MVRGGRAIPLVELLRNKMDGAADRVSRRKRVSERLRLKGMSCCAASFGLRMGIITLSDDEDEEGPHQQEVQGTELCQTMPGNGSTTVYQSPVVAATGMNLAAALEAERIFWAVQDQGGSVDSSPGPARPDNGGVNGEAANATPLRVSLMRLLDETDGNDCEIDKEGKGGDDSLCCVCMGKKKGAAFIPCGHTFCRGCSRDLWLNRGFCPLCNRSILEILDIF